jgi:hypothetical protein
MMIGYDIDDCFTKEHFRLRQRMTLTIKIYCSRLYIQVIHERVTSEFLFAATHYTYCNNFLISNFENNYN